MSYSLTLPHLGSVLDVAANLDARANASATTPTAPKAPDVAPPDCSDVKTGFDYVDTVLVGCCTEVRRQSGKSAAEKAQGVAQCVARGAAIAACIAAGPATYGVTVAFAPLCGKIGAWVANRVMGWDTKQKVTAGVADVICGATGPAGAICGFAAAELMGWMSDKLGPVVEGIFHPGAAADRERAKRRTDNKIYWASVASVRASETQIVEQWTASVNRIWSLFESTIAPADRADAKKRLGFGADYHSIALAMVNGGVPLGIMAQAELAKHHTDTYPACEVYGRKVNGSYGAPDPICPPFTLQLFYTAIQGAKSSHEESAMAEAASVKLAALATTFFNKLPQVEAAMATKCAVLATAYKQQRALAEAQAATEATLVAKAVAAAAAAEIAAAAAFSFSSDTRDRSIATAQAQYRIAAQAKVLLTFAASTAPSSASARKMSAALTRAQVARVKAKNNALHAQWVAGGVAAAGIVGIGYLFLRKA